MPGLYSVQPKGEDNVYLSIPPTPPIYPPIDVPVSIRSWAIIWDFKEKEKDQATVSGGGYNMVLRNNNELWLSVSTDCVTFQLEPEDGENFWRIKLLDQNVYATWSREPTENSAEITFQPADGSDYQVFKGIKYHKNLKVDKRKFTK